MKVKQYRQLLFLFFLVTLPGKLLFGHNISWNKATVTMQDDMVTLSMRLVQIDLLGAVDPGTDSTRIRSRDEWEKLLPRIRSYVFDNTHVSIDGSRLSDVVNETWNVENRTVGKRSDDVIISDTTTLGMLTLSRSWEIASPPGLLTWRSAIFANVDVPVKWVVLISRDTDSKKRLYTIVKRGETATYDFAEKSWKTGDGKKSITGDEATIWGKIRQLVTVGFTRMNLENIFASSGEPKVLIFYLLIAIVIGAFHALSPGHGKALIGAYIIGTKGTVTDAVMLGIVTAISHTISVLILGVVLLLAFDAVVPPAVMVYINVTSGSIIVLIGIYLLRQRLKGHTHDHASHTHDHALQHDHTHDHAPNTYDHEQNHTHHHHPHEHSNLSHSHSHGGGHNHYHVSMESIQKKGIWTNVIMGISGGMVPCPTALVILFLAVSLRQLALGIILIAFFSVGLAVTLTVLGILFAKGSTLITRYDNSGIVSKLPLVSSIIVIVIGLVILGRAVAGF